MVRSMKIVAAAGVALVLSAFPVFAQDLAVPADLDPFHIFTPAPPPPPAGAPVVVHHHHHHWHHHHWNHGPGHAAHHHAPKH